VIDVAARAVGFGGRFARRGGRRFFGRTVRRGAWIRGVGDRCAVSRRAVDAPFALLVVLEFFLVLAFALVLVGRLGKDMIENHEALRMPDRTTTKAVERWRVKLGLAARASSGDNRELRTGTQRNRSGRFSAGQMHGHGTQKQVENSPDEETTSSVCCGGAATAERHGLETHHSPPERL